MIMSILLYISSTFIS